MVSIGIIVGLLMIGVFLLIVYVVFNVVVNVVYKYYEIKSKKEVVGEGGKEVVKGVVMKDFKNFVFKVIVCVILFIVFIGKDVLLGLLIECVDYSDKWKCKDYINNCFKEVFNYKYVNILY